MTVRSSLPWPGRGRRARTGARPRRRRRCFAKSPLLERNGLGAELPPACGVLRRDLQVEFRLMAGSTPPGRGRAGNRPVQSRRKHRPSSPADCRHGQRNDFARDLRSDVDHLGANATVASPGRAKEMPPQGPHQQHRNKHDAAGNEIAAIRFGWRETRM